MQNRQEIEKMIFELAHIKSIPISCKLMLVGDFSDHRELSWSERLRRIPLKPDTRQRAVEESKCIETEKLMEEYQRAGIHWISIIDPEYPERLKQLYEPPVLLFYRGDVSLMKEPALSIVGSRKGSPYGKAAIDYLMPSFIRRFVICSGLAKGIDTMAHQAAIRQGGKTIAVIGTGLNVAYPLENAGLQRYIGEHHLLISEYPPQTKPDRHHFPLRNRLIAALSAGTIVVEAEHRSGSLITAQLALDGGNEVFCVPGPITHHLSSGTNYLIQQGAHCLYDGALVHEVLGI